MTGSSGKLIRKALKSRIMKRTACFAWLAPAAVFLLAVQPALSQSVPDSDRTIVVQVEGLTAEDRDALQHAVNAQPGLELPFACVPAGILVFAGSAGESKAAVRQRALPLLSARANGQRVTELNLNLVRTEQACAEARNR